MSSDKPSDRLIKQRIRNRIIEQLELTSSFDAQIDVQGTTPFVHVPYEVINGWEDWVRPGEWPLSGSPGPLTEEEVEAMRAFGSVWDDVAEQLPEDYPTLAEVQATEPWIRLRDAAQVALAVFSRRGRLPEDREAKST